MKNKFFCNRWYIMGPFHCLMTLYAFRLCSHLLSYVPLAGVLLRCLPKKHPVVSFSFKFTFSFDAPLSSLSVRCPLNACSLTTLWRTCLSCLLMPFWGFGCFFGCLVLLSIHNSGKREWGVFTVLQDFLNTSVASYSAVAVTRILSRRAFSNSDRLRKVIDSWFNTHTRSTPPLHNYLIVSLHIVQNSNKTTLFCFMICDTCKLLNIGYRRLTSVQRAGSAENLCILGGYWKFFSKFSFLPNQAVDFLATPVIIYGNTLKMLPF